MMKKIYANCFIILIWITSVYAKDVGGIKVDESVNFANLTMSLQGAGVRSKFIFDIYVGALYLKNKTDNPKQIIEDNSPMDIRMVITSSLVTGAKMREGFSDDFKVVQSLGYKADKQSIKKFLSTFDTKVHKGDIFDFVYIPKNKIFIYKNRKKTGVIESFDFKKSLYAIWLSSKPAQESLKKKMLGL